MVRKADVKGHEVTAVGASAQRGKARSDAGPDMALLYDAPVNVAPPKDVPVTVAPKEL